MRKGSKGKAGSLKNVKNLPNNKKKARGNVDGAFVRKIKELLKIVFPSVTCKETALLASLIGLLVIRTGLSIWLSDVNGLIVKAIIKRDLNMFIRRIFVLFLFAFPSCLVNSLMEYVTKTMGISFRTRMTEYFHNRYLQQLYYYKICNLDTRILNPDQRLTQDLEKWSTSLSSLILNFMKPLLDIVMFSKKLIELIGVKGPLTSIGWYLISGLIIRFISPEFGRLTAQEQQFEGDYRNTHSEILNHSEEIAFLQGHEWEKRLLNKKYKQLHNHIDDLIMQKFYMGIFDNMLVKYGSFIVGYAVLAMPVFGPDSAEYLKKVGKDPTRITKDYVRNSSLLINLSKAIGRLVVSYKDVQSLAGYTHLIYEVKTVLDDFDNNVYQRAQVKGGIKLGAAGRVNNKSDNIKFEDVPIVSPTGDVLVKSISFEINRGMNLFITGPNGCGKSSLFRILGELWPASGGVVNKPPKEDIFYIPQRPYLPSGKFRDQIIYPHSEAYMKNVKKVSDDDLRELLDIVKLGNLVDREGGWDKENEWDDVLAGGEKQRIAMARLFYHSPKFAIMDECTSAVQLDVEAIMYSHCKELGITLITVSHRQTLWQYHDFNLKFDGAGNWEMGKIDRV